MLKALFKQLINRKKSNGWIALELLLVFCVLWYLIDYFFVLTYNYSLPSYMDTNHTYQVNITQFPTDHPEYNETENEADRLVANYNRILNHIRSYSGVTNISVSFHQTTPGSDSYNGGGFRNSNDTLRSCTIRYITIDPTSDYFSVFGLSEDNGNKRASVQNYEWSQPNTIVLNRIVASQLFPEGSAVGQTIEQFSRPDNKFVIAGVIDDVKRYSSGRPEPLCYRYQRLDSSNIDNAEISIRINSSADTPHFLPDFIQNMETSLRIGNFYFVSAVSYNKNIEQYNEEQGYNTERRTRMYLMIFFLVNVILCVIGTFWYRVNIRREEIGLRMALGSSRKSISGILMLEGICLLVLITLPAMLIEWQFVHGGLIETYGKNNSPVVYLPDKIFLRFLITNIITWIVMAVVIITAIWLPARRASTMAPAEALHYE